MAEKKMVCEGARCICKYGTTPDKLKVLTHQKHYINGEKLTASNKDVGATFEKNTFGSCNRQRNRPCNASVQEWKGFYEKITLSNGGKVLLEDSTASCPVGGEGCISIQFHGQVAVPNEQNEANADDDVLAVLYPFGNLKKDDNKQDEAPETDDDNEVRASGPNAASAYKPPTNITFSVVGEPDWDPALAQIVSVEWWDAEMKNKIEKAAIGDKVNIQTGVMYFNAGDMVNVLVEKNNNGKIENKIFAGQVYNAKNAKLKEPITIESATSYTIKSVSGDNVKANFNVRLKVENHKPVIIIDPGHGGDDCGTPKRKGKRNEADITLITSKFTVERLKQLFQSNAEILMTRETDINPGGSGQRASLKARVDFSKEHHADIFVAIHVNDTDETDEKTKKVIHHPDSDYVSVHTQPSSTNGSKLLSRNIAVALKGVVESKNGVEEVPQDLYVCRNQPTISCVLVEIGIITNERQEELMNTDDYLQKIGNAIGDAIYKTAQSIDSNSK